MYLLKIEKDMAGKPLLASEKSIRLLVAVTGTVMFLQMVSES